MSPENKALIETYPQYYKDVSHLEVIDVYRILDLYGVTDPTAQHSLKKILLSGQRTGGKPPEKDIKEARDTLTRGLAMRREDADKGRPVITANTHIEMPAPIASVPVTPPPGYAPDPMPVPMPPPPPMPMVPMTPPPTQGSMPGPELPLHSEGLAAGARGTVPSRGPWQPAAGAAAANKPRL